MRGCSLRLKGWRWRLMGVLFRFEVNGVEVEGCSLRLKGWRLRGVV